MTSNINKAIRLSLGLVAFLSSPLHSSHLHKQADSSSNQQGQYQLKRNNLERQIPKEYQAKPDEYNRVCDHRDELWTNNLNLTGANSYLKNLKIEDNVEKMYLGQENVELKEEIRRLKSHLDDEQPARATSILNTDVELNLEQSAFMIKWHDENSKPHTIYLKNIYVALGILLLYTVIMVELFGTSSKKDSSKQDSSSEANPNLNGIS